MFGFANFIVIYIHEIGISVIPEALSTYSDLFTTPSMKSIDYPDLCRVGFLVLLHIVITQWYTSRHFKLAMSVFQFSVSFKILLICKVPILFFPHSISVEELKTFRQ